MGNIYYASEYKNRIINLLLKNENFIKLVNPTPSEYEDLDIVDVMLGGEWIINGEKVKEQGHIFDYEFVSDTTTDEKTFIFVEADIPNVERNLLTEFGLYICVFTSKNLVRITNDSVPTVKEVKNMGYFASSYANRVDVICDIVDRILNGSDKFHSIGSVKPASNRYVSIYKPNSNYYGKCLRYTVTNLNEIEGSDCGN